LLNSLRFSVDKECFQRNQTPTLLDRHSEDDLMDRNYFIYWLRFDPPSCFSFYVFKELLPKRLVIEICFELNVVLCCRSNNKERRL
jgi:hypothetical protein